jgi:RND family efflux transporter MFP subunit
MSDGMDSSEAEASGGPYMAALSELVACETLAQTCGWAAQWLQATSGADAVLVWTVDPVQPVFNCTGASGEGLGRVLRRTVPRSDGYVRRLIRDRQAFAVGAAELLGTNDPWLAPLAKSFGAALAIPFDSPAGVIGAAAILFREGQTDLEAALGATSEFVPIAAHVISRDLARDKRTSGNLHAIERLTNLYDLSKAFGSTLEWTELTAIIARKAADFANAEVASLWILEGDEGAVSLAATAASENYEVENVPDSVGASIVGDVLGDEQTTFENDLPANHLLRTEGPFPIQSVLKVPLQEDETTTVGALVIVNKRGRRPEFSETDALLLTDLGHQAVRALHNARRSGAERRAEELDSLLAVSREITSTLDLDRVMKTIANASATMTGAARCAVAVLQRGKLRLGAVSGMDEINRSDPSVVRTTNLLEWVYFGGNEISVNRPESGEIEADRPEVAEKFKVFFDESGMRSYLAMILQDEEGKLGVMSFESADPLGIGEEGRDLLQILVNQGTVAVRNAQLYQQVPLAGFWKPLLEKQRKLAALPKARLRRRLIIAAVLLLALVALPWKIRVTGPARVLPGRRLAVTAPVSGVIAGVVHREGDEVKEGDLIAVLHDENYRAAAAQARSDFAIASSDFARAQAEGNTSSLATISARLEETRARNTVAQENLSQTQIRAPGDGVIVTRGLDERVGQMVQSGAELAVIANTRSEQVEVAVPETEYSLLQPGQRVTVKLNSFPTHVFSGRISRISPVVIEEGENRFVIAQAELDSPPGAVRPGMLGKAKITTETRRLGYAVFRKPARWFWAKLWPLMP